MFGSGCSGQAEGIQSILEFVEKTMIDLQEVLAVFGLKIVAALAILIVGIWLSRLLRSLVKQVMTRSGVEVTLTSFIGNLAYYSGVTFVVLAALNQLGIQTASFIAVLGAAGLAIGLALQGALSNLAAGVLMIIFRPFKVADFIEGSGVAGIVEEIQILTTTLRTADNKTIIVPNAKLYQNNITNYSAKPYRRLDLEFSVSDQNDIERVKRAIADVLEQEQRVLKEPVPTVGVKSFAGDTLNFVVRPWVMNQDYEDVLLTTTEKLKKRFDTEEIK